MPDNLTKSILSTEKENMATEEFRSILYDTRTNQKGHELGSVLETYG
jgi:hypothetical protein